MATTRRPTQGALILISAAQLMVVIDSTIANIALPLIQRDLGISQSNLAWVVTAYSLSFGGLLLLGGRLGDVYGRRRVFIIGVALFAVASALGGLATREGPLLAARALQGTGAALASPAGLSLLTTMFPKGAQRNRALSLYATMSGIGGAVGLILGGWLTGMTRVGTLPVDGWRLTFLINVPIGLAAAFTAPRVLDEFRGTSAVFDFPGAVTGTLALGSLVLGLGLAGNPHHGWSDHSTLGVLAAGMILLGVFIRTEKRVGSPLLRFGILTDRTRGTSLVVLMLVASAMFSMFFFVSQYMYNVLGLSPLETGLAFLPFSVILPLVANVASRLLSYVDPRWLAGFGLTVAGCGIYGYALLPADASVPGLSVDASYWPNIFPCVILMGVGMGFVFVPLTVTAVHGVEPSDSGVASGVLNAMQQVGGALGVAVMATIAANTMNSSLGRIHQGFERLGTKGSSAARSPELIVHVAFTEGATTAFLVSACIVFAAAAICMLLLRVTHREIAGETTQSRMLH